MSTKPPVGDAWNPHLAAEDVYYSAFAHTPTVDEIESDLADLVKALQDAFDAGVKEGQRK